MTLVSQVYKHRQRQQRDDGYIELATHVEWDSDGYGVTRKSGPPPAWLADVPTQAGPETIAQTPPPQVQARPPAAAALSQQPPVYPTAAPAPRAAAMATQPPEDAAVLRAALTLVSEQREYSYDEAVELTEHLTKSGIVGPRWVLLDEDQGVGRFYHKLRRLDNDALKQEYVARVPPDVREKLLLNEVAWTDALNRAPEATEEQKRRDGTNMLLWRVSMFTQKDRSSNVYSSALPMDYQKSVSAILDVMLSRLSDDAVNTYMAKARDIKNWSSSGASVTTNGSTPRATIEPIGIPLRPQPARAVAPVQTYPGATAPSQPTSDHITGAMKYAVKRMITPQKTEIDLRMSSAVGVQGPLELYNLEELQERKKRGAYYKKISLMIPDELKQAYGEVSQRLGIATTRSATLAATYPAMVKNVDTKKGNADADAKLILAVKASMYNADGSKIAGDDLWKLSAILDTMLIKLGKPRLDAYIAAATAPGITWGVDTLELDPELRRSLVDAPAPAVPAPPARAGPAPSFKTYLHSPGVSVRALNREIELLQQRRATLETQFNADQELQRSQADALRNEITGLESERSAAEAFLASATNRQADKQATLDALEDALAANSTTLDNQTERLTNIDEQIANKDAKLQALESQIAQREAQSQQALEELNTVIQAKKVEVNALEKAQKRLQVRNDTLLKENENQDAQYIAKKAAFQDLSTQTQAEEAKLASLKDATSTAQQELDLANANVDAALANATEEARKELETLRVQIGVLTSTTLDTLSTEEFDYRPAPSDAHKEAIETLLDAKIGDSDYSYRYIVERPSLYLTVRDVEGAFDTVRVDGNTLKFIGPSLTATVGGTAYTITPRIR